MKTTEESTIKVLAAITGICILEGIALMLGIDGTVLSLVVAALAGLGGYELRAHQE